MVITSSTTTTGSPASRVKPRRRVITPSCRSVKSAAAAEGARDLVGHQDAAQGGRDHRRRLGLAQQRPQRGAPGRRPGGVASGGSMSTRAHCR